MIPSSLWGSLDGAGFQAARMFLSLLWQSSILLAAVGILAWFLRKRSAAIRHTLWLCALLAVPLLPLLGWAVTGIGTPSARLAVVPSYAPPEDLSIALPEPASTAGGPRGILPASGLEAAPKVEVAQRSALRYPWAMGLLLYGAGAGVLLLMVGMGRRRLGRWILDGQVVTDARALEAFRSAARDLGLRRRFILVENREARASLALGILHPVVLLPEGFLRELSDAELRAVAVHELAHLRRHDPAALTLVSLLRAVLFFHPLVWLGARQVSALAEQVADDAVLAATGEPLSYAKMLARLAEGLPSRALSTELAAGILFSRSAFLRRVEAILSDRRDQFRKLSRIALAATLLSLLISLAVAIAVPLGEKERTPPRSTYSLLELADADPKYEGKAAYEDTLTAFTSTGETLWKLSGINTCETCGANHSILWNGTDRTIWLCERAGTGRLLKVDHEGKTVFEKRDLRPNALGLDPKTGEVWTLTNDGTIYGLDTAVLDHEGQVLRRFPVRGLDIIYSRKDDCFWIVGKDVTKCGRNGQILFQLKAPFPYIAVACDVNERDGSLFALVRQHPDIATSANCLHIFASDGKTQQVIELGKGVYTGLAVDAARDALWVSEREALHKFTLEGKKAAEVRVPGFSVCVEPDTGCVWVGGNKGLYRLNPEGKTLVHLPGSCWERWLCMASLGEKGATQPRFQGTVFINNIKYGPDNGASGPLGPVGKLTCGHPGAVSEVTWQFKGNKEGKDNYLFERRFPTDGPKTSTERKEVAYAGKELTVFQDDTQRVVILPPMPGFCPVIERTVNHSGEDCLIDLDTEKLFSGDVPKKVMDQGPIAINAWVAEQGIDAGGGMQPETMGLIGFDLIALPVPNECWDTKTPQSLLADRENAFKAAKPGNPVFLSAKGGVPATWIFQTREGSVGVLQIVGFTDNPRGVKIRYKLILAPVPAPSADQRLDTVLDQKKIAAIALPGVTLQEAVEILKAQLGKEANFQIDPALLQKGDIPITLDLKDVTLRTLFTAMLKPHGLEFTVWNNSIYISTPEGCQRVKGTAAPKIEVSIQLVKPDEEMRKKLLPVLSGSRRPSPAFIGPPFLESANWDLGERALAKATVTVESGSKGSVLLRTANTDDPKSGEMTFQADLAPVLSDDRQYVQVGLSVSRKEVTFAKERNPRTERNQATESTARIPLDKAMLTGWDMDGAKPADGFCFVVGVRMATETTEAAGKAQQVELDKLKAELVGRVEDFFQHNYRDITARTTIEWGDVATDEKGNRSIRYKCLATIWDKEKMILNEIFTFDPQGNFVAVKKVEGFPQKYVPEPADTGTQAGLIKLVEKFFNGNFRDVTSHETIEWGPRLELPNGNVSIHYKYDATIWNKDHKVMNQVFTFDAKGEFVEVKDAVAREGVAAPATVSTPATPVP